MATPKHQPASPQGRRPQTKGVKSPVTVVRHAGGTFIQKSSAKKSSLPPCVTVVDGYKIYRSAAEPVHISREQIARAIASLK